MALAKPFEDLTGRTFGPLEVAELAIPGNTRKTRVWAVRCTTCGDARTIKESGLRQAGRVRAGHCDGCKNRILLPAGTRFGRWVVVEEMPPDSGRRSRYLCRCECGRRQVVFGNILAAGRSAACVSCRKKKPENL